MQEELQIIQEQLNEMKAKIKSLTSSVENQSLPDHYHNGFDASNISWINIYQRKVYISHTIQGTAAATATNYGVFFIAPFACVVTMFKEVHQTAGTDAGAVTLDLEKLTGTQALDSGVSALASTLSLKATINTVQTGTLTATNTNRNLALGDRLSMKDSGTLTAVANVTIIAELQII